MSSTARTLVGLGLGIAAGLFLLGRDATPGHRHWSVLDDVLHWGG